MPMRFGEMVLIIRTQDYASRNLNRLSANLGKLSTMQRLQRQLQTQQLRQARILSRMDTTKQDLGALQKRLALENAISDVQMRRGQEQRRLRGMRIATASTGMLRGPQGQFLGAAAPHIQAASAEVARLKAAEKALIAEHSALMSELARTRPTLARMGTDAATLKVARLTESLRIMRRELRIVQGDIAVTQHAVGQLHWENISRAGQAISRFGRVAQLAGLVTVGSFVAMGNAAANFSANATLAATQARNLGGDTADALNKSKIIQQAVLDQMQKYPVSAQEMTNATYEIFSSLDLMNNKGIVNTTKGLKILELANKAAVAGGVSLDDSIQGIIITLNNFDPGLTHVNATLNTMFDIVRFGNIHFSDLTTVLGKVAPAAKSVGFSLEDVAGALAQATRTLPAGMVSAGFSQLMRVFADPNFQEGIRVASKLRLGKVIDIAPGGQLEKPLEILRDILTIFPELARGGKETAQFFRDVTKAGQFALTGRATTGREYTIQIRRVFETLVQNFGSVQELQAAILANNGELQKSFATMMQDPGVQWKVFINQMQALVLIIGQAALPALLSLAGGIQKVVEWFRNLSPHTRRLIVEIGVFGGAAMLAVGVISSLVGSIVQLVSHIGLLSGGIPILTRVGGLLAAMGGVTAMALILKTAVTGDASAWEFLQGAMAGAIAGSIFGPEGAIIGGITVPVLMEVMRLRPRTAQQKAFQEYQKSLTSGVAGAAQKVEKFFNVPFTHIGLPVTPTFNKQQFDRDWNRLVVAAKKGINIANIPVDPKVRELFQKYRGDIKALKKPTESWSDVLRKATKDAKEATQTKAWNDLLQKIGQVGGAQNKAADAAKAHAQAVKDGTTAMNSAVKEAAKNLANTYDQLRQQNETALGGLFQGPTMQGILGNVFSNINDTLRQFGVQIPVPFAILKQDLHQSVTYFKRWRGDIAKLLKRGMPIEMVQQLQEMGPQAGIPIAEGLLQGGKGGFKGLIKEWKNGQRLIDKFTKQDMQNKLKLWNSYGKDAAWATIQGIIDNPRNYRITKMYEAYVKKTYAAPLQKIFQQAYTTSLKNAQAIAAASAKGLPKGLTVTGAKPPTARQIFTREQAQAQRTINYLTTKFVGPLSQIQQRQLRAARRHARFARYELAALPSVQRQIAAHRGQHNYYVTYEGDKVHITASGASVEAVARALAKKHFQRKTKGKGTTSKPWMGRT